MPDSRQRQGRLVCAVDQGVEGEAELQRAAHQDLEGLPLPRHLRVAEYAHGTYPKTVGMNPTTGGILNLHSRDGFAA